MAGTYWITFRIAHSGARDRRTQALLAAVRRMTLQKCWTEIDDFLMFDSEMVIDDIASEISDVIDDSHDLALLSNLDASEARAIGVIEDAMLFLLMPNCQRFHPETAAPPVPEPSLTGSEPPPAEPSGGKSDGQ